MHVCKPDKQAHMLLGTRKTLRCYFLEVTDYGQNKRRLRKHGDLNWLIYTIQSSLGPGALASIMAISHLAEDTCLRYLALLLSSPALWNLNGFTTQPTAGEVLHGTDHRG